MLSTVPMLSFNNIGTPCNAPITLPAARIWSRFLASMSASGLIVKTDCNVGPAVSINAIRSRYAWTKASEETWSEFSASAISGNVPAITPVGWKSTSAAGFTKGSASCDATGSDFSPQALAKIRVAADVARRSFLFMESDSIN